MPDHIDTQFERVDPKNFVEGSPRASRAQKEYLKQLEINSEVIKRIKEQAQEELCCTASVQCHHDRESNRIFACCPHSQQCLAFAVQDLKKVKEFGVTYDGELVANTKKSRPMGLGKKRREQLALEPEPQPKTRTEQVWNKEWGCWETVPVE